jgi:hypothetical protein
VIAGAMTVMRRQALVRWFSGRRIGHPDHVVYGHLAPALA